MDVVAAFIAGGKPSELVQPGEGAFDDPAVAAESGAVLGLASRDAVGDSALAQQAPVLVVVVATIGE